ncbi:Alpha/Beta hydrolase protein, partial [Tribonema minus]
RGGLIFLHGSGDTGPGVQEWLDYITGGSFERTLAGQGILCLYPTAPLRPYTMCQGELRHVWHDRLALDFNSIPDEEHVLESMEIVEGLLEELEEAGVDRSAVVLGGFSMGGGVALQCIAAPWACHLAGVFSLSSFLHAASPLYAQQQQQQQAPPPPPPLYTAHGLRDEMVSHAWARSTAQGLTSAGYAVTHAEYATLGHDMSRAEVEALLQWIGARV